MWFQVELPEPVQLTEIQFESVVGRQPQLPPMSMSGGRPQPPPASGQSSNGSAPAGTAQAGASQTPPPAAGAASTAGAAPAGSSSAGSPSTGTPPTGSQSGASPAATGSGAGARTAPAAAGDGPPPALVNAIMASMGFPRGYKVELSMDGTTWGTPVAEGQGTGPSTIVMFAPTRAKFLRITQTATTDNAPNWSIQRLRLYQPGSTGGTH
jgi:hypothetical protein